MQTLREWDSRIHLKQLRITDLEYESSKITAQENANKYEQLEECECTASLEASPQDLCTVKA